jgi:isopenicillin N synthase-like dioxygenase
MVRTVDPDEDGTQCFTILWQQPGIQALQVRNTGGEWIDAPPMPGTLVIKCALLHSSSPNLRF